MDRGYQVVEIIGQSKWRRGVLRLVQDLDLPDWWVGAGFVRNALWDHVHGKPMTPLNDIDVIYFDPERTDPAIDEEIRMELQGRGPRKPWSVQNQARMHEEHGHAPYESSLDAIRRWPETATALAVRFTPEGHILLAAPHGVDDALDLIVRPTAPELTEVVRSRAEAKGWAKKWPRLTFAL